MAQRAIEIDVNLAEAHVTLAMVSMFFDADRRIAEREFRRAITLNSNYAVARQWYGAHLCFMADFQRGLPQLRQAQQLEPLSSMISAQLGVGFYLARRYNEAAQVLKNIVAFEPAFWAAHFFLGLVCAQEGDDRRAIAEFKSAVELSSRHPLTVSGLGHVLGRTGRREQAAEKLEELHIRSRTEYVAPDHFALIHLALGDERLALDRLQEAVAKGLRLAPGWQLIQGSTRCGPTSVFRVFCSTGSNIPVLRAVERNGDDTNGAHR